jgi:hypothetical protein
MGRRGIVKKLCMEQSRKTRQAWWRAPVIAAGVSALAIAAWIVLSLPGITEVLPWRLRFWNWMTLRDGAAIVANVERFRQEHGRLPDASNGGELSALGFELGAVAEYPLYSVQGGGYEITYVEGFDGPYIVYSSSAKEWRCELC